MRKQGKYDNYTASDLARETRALGLDKPQVLTLREWADWLAERKAEHDQQQDAAKVAPAAVVETEPATEPKVDPRAIERNARLTGLQAMKHDDLDAEADTLGVTWPDEGTGANGAVLLGDKVNALMAAWDADGAAEETGEDSI